MAVRGLHLSPGPKQLCDWLQVAAVKKCSNSNSWKPSQVFGVAGWDHGGPSIHCNGDGTGLAEDKPNHTPHTTHHSLRSVPECHSISELQPVVMPCNSRPCGKWRVCRGCGTKGPPCLCHVVPSSRSGCPKSSKRSKRSQNDTSFSEYPAKCQTQGPTTEYTNQDSPSTSRLESVDHVLLTVDHGPREDLKRATGCTGCTS